MRRPFFTLSGLVLLVAGLGAAQAKPPAEAASANLFAAHSWLPPVRVVKAPPPPPPRAPALPFTYLGKLQDGAAVTVFVAQGERSHVLKAGDSVASYRVDSVTANDMVFIYLPLGEKQRLSFGTAN